MNTRELIKKYNGKLNVRLDLQMIQIYKEFIHDLQQLDEPQKVKIPQFVADVIEGVREETSELEKAFHFAWWSDSDEFTEWYEKKSNRDVFARAWLDGYEVEKEPKYTVRVKATLGQYLGRYYLNNEELTPQFTRTHFPVKEKLPTFTRKELEEANFGWVFDCEGIEIEEVE